MTKEHINSAFDDDLNELAKLITTMGNLALSQFTAVIDGMADDEVKLKSLNIQFFQNRLLKFFVIVNF